MATIDPPLPITIGSPIEAHRAAESSSTTERPPLPITIGSPIEAALAPRGGRPSATSPLPITIGSPIEATPSTCVRTSTSIPLCRSPSAAPLKPRCERR